MEVPKLKIGSITAKIPIIQGGMGVRVSLASLASAVANEGGIGTISTIGLGDIDAPRKEFEAISVEALRNEIRKAKSMVNEEMGHLAVNVMGVLSNAADLVKASVQEGVKIIVYGAGLPMKLPLWVTDRSVNLVPIISSARVSDLICKAWDKKYEITPDAFVLEGPLAGGHLGYSNEQLDHIDDFSLEKILPEVLEVNKKYEDKYGKKIPVIVAGGIYDGGDIAKMMDLGASGVQMGTRFVCTEECGVSDEFKNAYLTAKEEDIVIVKSPVGLPGRAIRNAFLKKLEEVDKIKVKCPYKCLTVCKMGDAKYCIAKALLNSYFGKIDEGLIFCGQNAHRIKQIIPVKDLVNELLAGVYSAQPKPIAMI
jgi:nitronate monooxygenase